MDQFCSPSRQTTNKEVKGKWQKKRRSSWAGWAGRPRFPTPRALRTSCRAWAAGLPCAMQHPAGPRPGSLLGGWASFDWTTWAGHRLPPRRPLAPSRGLLARQVEQALATRMACGAVACVRRKTTPFANRPSISKPRAYIRSQEAGAQKKFFLT
jgi:hypothetical protein